MTDLEPRGVVSPFDAIRRIDESGESWSGRDMQPHFGYDSWRRFEDAIDRARISCESAGHDPEHHFATAVKVIKGGRWGEQEVADVRLTRFGAYLVAMNADVKKSEVARAQTYFAVKTREAEVAEKRNLAALTGREQLLALAAGILDAEKRAAEANERADISDAALESAAPAIAYVDRYVANGDAVILKVWAAQFGLTDRQARDLLIQRNIIYRRSIGQRWSGKHQRVIEEYEYAARADRVTYGWFDPRPQHNAPRHHNGQVRTTLYVRQQYALQLAAKLGLAAPSGQIALPDTAPSEPGESS